jgi:NADPH-dependent 2,4-dienoyl-CoA reductase/sulfur reductase-like enzyme/nitrite reductase/ring-hydroxylating ferredoxin subunit
VETRVPLTRLLEGTITKAMLGETGIVVIRTGDTVQAFGANCPHAGAPLEEGAVCNGRLVCPWHKGTFRIADGGLVEPPPLHGLTRYKVRIEANQAVVSDAPIAPPAPARRRHGRIAAIVGSGAAATSAAATLRQEGFDGRVLLIGEEALQPYDRTSLSKFVVAGEMKVADVPPLLEPADWTAMDIERLDTAVTRLDARARRIWLADGSVIDYDVSLLATGGIAKRPEVPGADLENVFTLRNVQDAAAIFATAAPGTDVVIIGSSFIGLEVASGLRARGVNVTVVAPERIPLARQFGNEIGAALRRLHEAKGVTFRLGANVIALEGDERVRAVVLKGGDRLPAGCVLLGVGVVPATGFVEGVEICQDGGIVVDASMRAAAGLFVAGDCARFPWRGERVRIEHWRVAQQHGRVAALGMLGQSARYAGVPYFWTYHYGANFEYLGHAERWDELHIDGDPDRQDFFGWQVAGGEVAGVIACGRQKATAVLIEHMRRPLMLSEARAIVSQV